jgi:ferredoxin, 2Fe-2S
MPKLSVPQKNITLDVNENSNLMNELLLAGVPVASSCEGDGICSMCRVLIEGKINDITPLEAKTLERNKCESGFRLSCQVHIKGDVQVRTKYW